MKSPSSGGSQSSCGKRYENKQPHQHKKKRRHSRYGWPISLITLSSSHEQGILWRPVQTSTESHFIGDASYEWQQEGRLNGEMCQEAGVLWKSAWPRFGVRNNLFSWGFIDVCIEQNGAVCERGETVQVSLALHPGFLTWPASTLLGSSYLVWSLQARHGVLPLGRSLRAWAHIQMWDLWSQAVSHPATTYSFCDNTAQASRGVLPFLWIYSRPPVEDSLLWNNLESYGSRHNRTISPG